MTNAELITQFYTAFANGDAEAMVACYHTDIQFQDPAFGVLKNEDAKNMWRMLISRSKGNIKITFNNVTANEKTGSAKWVAEYFYSATGRNVINIISAEFEFADGKIIKHTDTFDLYKWTKQALGTKGYLLGWTAFMRKKIQEQSGKLLKKYTEKKTADN
ncbi:MAG: nuclear transport factor 2 family protein [Bacteroidia bacterium]